jgi:hypothetical protein
MDEPLIQPTEPDPQPPLPYGKTVTNALEVTLLALLLGALVEILFDGHPLGINFPVLTWACAGALLLASYLEGVRPSRYELLLAAPILFLSAMAAVRKEPLTTFLNVIGVLMLFALWVRTFRAGRLLNFGWIDFALSLILVPIEAIFRPWATFRTAWQGVFGVERGRGRGWAILRGVLLALPVVAVFLGLLAAADIVFGAAVERLLEWLDIERILGWVGDGLVIAISGFFFLGALVMALLEPERRELIGEKRPFLRPFLGLLETGIVLGAVDLLFFIFVLFQVRYLFGGEANITAAGYTYSEYARRGFSELVAVAVLSLGMILLLGMFGKREGAREERTFRGLSTALVALLGVILASALMRLLLYENAYGFTRQRTYTHVFIFWMAAGFAVFLLLLYRGELRRFAPAVALGVLGFGVTLNLMNLDAFIVRRNVDRYWGGTGLDTSYLLTLSEDAVPALAAVAGEVQPGAREDLLPGLACQLERLRTQRDRLDWPAYHIGLARAVAALEGVEGIGAYTPGRGENGEPVVTSPSGEQIQCGYGYYYWD